MAKKHEAGLILYREGVPQKDIAGILNTTAKTVTNWKQKYDWDGQTVGFNIARKTSVDNATSALSHQTRVLRLIADKLSAQIQPGMEVDELKKLLIEKGEIDAVQKLFTTIKGKELEWGDRVKTIREFMQHLKEQNLDLAKKVVPFTDDYLNSIRR